MRNTRIQTPKILKYVFRTLTLQILSLCIEYRILNLVLRMWNIPYNLFVKSKLIPKYVYLSVPAKRTGSCGIVDNLDLNTFKAIWETSTPSMYIWPSDNWTSLNNAAASEDFPTGKTYKWSYGLCVLDCSITSRMLLY